MDEGLAPPLLIPEAFPLGQGDFMTDRSIDLDDRRGMAEQKATDLRRKRAEVEAQHDVLVAYQRDLEASLFAADAATWLEAAAKARYLLERFAASHACDDPRLQAMVAAVLSDFSRLSPPAEPASRT